MLTYKMSHSRHKSNFSRAIPLYSCISVMFMYMEQKKGSLAVITEQGDR
jgi:hypothetical protein